MSTSAYRFRHLIALAAASVTVLVATSLPLTLAAQGLPQQPHDHTHSGEEHAAEDLVGTPISEVERRTAENAERIFRQTGRRPGVAPRLQKGGQTSTDQRMAAAVDADPGVSGAWSGVIDLPIVPIFQAILPNGKVLMWDSVGDDAAESYPTHTFTRAVVYDPATESHKRVDVQGYNIFCAGFAHLQNGNILVAGGNKDSKLAGIVQTHIFNWQTETWTRGPNMAAGRWYPSLTTMANGETTIVGGGPAVAEVYQTNNVIRSLTSFNNASYGGRSYPFQFSRPDTQLGLIGPYTTGYTLNTAGNGAVTGTFTRDAIHRDSGSFATYEAARSLVVGGGNITEGGVAKVPTKTAVIVNSAGLVPTVSATGSMSIGRRQHNATVLADGSVLVTGGQSSVAQSSLVDLDDAVTAAERWDPATGTWTVLSSAARVRQYHSTANLLPDGRVLTGGGGVCGTCMGAGYLEKNIEYFTPPYLYKKDGSGELAARPTISTAPATININTNFSITSSEAADIRKVGLVGMGDATHGVDQGQRYVPLKFTVSSTTLTVTGPVSGGVAPPGYYMLFITDSAGVPSVATMVQVARGPKPLMSAVRNSGAARCIDVPGASLAIRTLLQTYACNGTKAQAVTRMPADNTLRVLGNCLDVPGGDYAVGKRIQTYGCNGTAAQAWSFRTDGTIRPIASTGLCLAAASTVDRAAVQLARCSTSTLQKWTL